MASNIVTATWNCERSHAMHATNANGDVYHLWGVDFPWNQPVQVQDADLIEKLRTLKCFKLEGATVTTPVSAVAEAPKVEEDRPPRGFSTRKKSSEEA